VDAQANAEIIEDGLLTVEQACRLLAVSRSFLYSRMDAGAIPFCRLGRARRIPRRSLIDYAASRLNGGAIPPQDTVQHVGR